MAKTKKTKDTQYLYMADVNGDFSGYGATEQEALEKLWEVHSDDGGPVEVDIYKKVKTVTIEPSEGFRVVK